MPDSWAVLSDVLCEASGPNTRHKIWPHITWSCTGHPEHGYPVLVCVWAVGGSELGLLLHLSCGREKDEPKEAEIRSASRYYRREHPKSVQWLMMYITGQLAYCCGRHYKMVMPGRNSPVFSLRYLNASTQRLPSHSSLLASPQSPPAHWPISFLLILSKSSPISSFACFTRFLFQANCSFLGISLLRIV